MINKEFSVNKVICSHEPIIFDENKCINCNACVNVCQCDVLYPGEKTPMMMYPGECYYCGGCVMTCKIEGAIKLVHPLMNQANFIEKNEE